MSVPLRRRLPGAAAAAAAADCATVGDAGEDPGAAGGKAPLLLFVGSGAGVAPGFGEPVVPTAPGIVPGVADPGAGGLVAPDPGAAGAALGGAGAGAGTLVTLVRVNGAPAAPATQPVTAMVLLEVGEAVC